jgi:hypothetical protein
VLVTIQFPCDLAVSHLVEIQITDLEPGFERSALTVHAVRVPVDLRAIIKAFITQQSEAMLRDEFGTLNNLASRVRKKLAQLRAEFGNLLRRKKELPRWTSDVRAEMRINGGPCFEAPIINASGRLLAYTIGQLGAAHCLQPSQDAFPIQCPAHSIPRWRSNSV